jgi:PKD repeat protein
MRNPVRLVLTTALSLLLLGSVSAVPALAAPPANDAFANAAIISSLPISSVVDTTDSTIDPGELQFCSFLPRTVWYSFTPVQNGTLRADNTGSSSLIQLNISQANGPGLSNLIFLGCAQNSNPLEFGVAAGATYYFQMGSMDGGVGELHFNLQSVPAPSNDNFADAIRFGALPFTDTSDQRAATLQAGEPNPSCAVSSIDATAWYVFTPLSGGSVTVSVPSYAFIAAYSGSALTSLTELGCRPFGGPLTLRYTAGTPLYMQVGGLFASRGPITLSAIETPPPQAQFFLWPSDPSIFDPVQFIDQSFDPAGAGFQTWSWSFGDGTSGTGQFPTHRFTKDGDYTTTLTVKTQDGRTASTSQTIQVRTHDVAISKLAVPANAKAGQTREITVTLKNTRSTDIVQVRLLKSSPAGFELVGTLTQTVPVTSGGKTTPFTFNYTFTAADASVGKVTFRTDATIVGARDALPADNEAIASPTRVNP